MPKIARMPAMPRTKKAKIARVRNIVLSERDFAAFVAAINGPAKPLTAGLVAAAADYESRRAASAEIAP